MVVVEVFPLLELVVEDLGVVDHDPLEHPAELLSVDAMGALEVVPVSVEVEVAVPA
jgi:hypothetical protein